MKHLRATGARALACVLGAAGVGACANAYIGVPDDGGTVVDSAALLDAAPATDGSPEGKLDASSSDAPPPTFVFTDNFDSEGSSAMPLWDTQNFKLGTVSREVGTLVGGSSPKVLRANVPTGVGGATNYAQIAKSVKAKIPSGKVSFLFKLDAALDGVSGDGMTLLKVILVTAEKRNRSLRFGLRQKSDGYGGFVGVQIEGETNYRESAVDTGYRLAVGETHRVVVDYDARAPAAGKPMVTAMIDGKAAGTIDGDKEPTRSYEADARLYIGVSSEDLGVTVLIDDFVATGVLGP